VRKQNEQQQQKAASDGVPSSEGGSSEGATPDSAVKTPHFRRRSRCPLCGFIHAGSRATKICPGCGSSSENFQPFEEAVAARRARILALRLHPITAHAAPAFAATLLVLAAVLALADSASPLGAAIIGTIQVLSVLLPISIVVAAATGLVDAKARVKKRTTPLLIRKLAVSALFFALSFAAGALALLTTFEAAMLPAYAVLMALCSACALYLGRSGSLLRNALVPE
jgi:hypothetical protein